MLIVLLGALFLDYYLGAPPKYHPLVMFGQFADYLELRLNEAPLDKDSAEQANQKKRINGLIALLVCLLPAWWLTVLIIPEGFIGLLFEAAILYLALGLNSLQKHAQQILQPLYSNDLSQARQALSQIVSCDTRQMDSEAICRAGTESVLENGSNAVFGAIFWFIIAGAPGVVVYRLSNTLDAMWGYKTASFNNFGYFTAKLDDILNFVPARLTALSYALTGNWNNATRCWLQQGAFWESHNAGVVMASGAGALGVRLGGAKQYYGELKQRVELGCGAKPEPDSLAQACQLVNRSTILWVIVVALITIPGWFY